MIIWGRGEGSAVLGDFEAQECPVCEKTVPFQAVLHYTYRHIWYLFSWVTGREYYAVCSHCGNGVALDKAEAKKTFPKDAVPFMKKKGWLVAVVLFALLLGYGFIKNSEDNKRYEEYLSSPQVGDVYLANLAPLEGGGYEDSAGAAYGAMNLVHVEGDLLMFAISNEAFTRRKGIRKALSSATPLGYDVENPLVLGRSYVRELLGKGTIYEIRRK